MIPIPRGTLKAIKQYVESHSTGQSPEEAMHCRMIRYHTVASGDEYCDFWQVGDKSQAWREADKDKLK